MKMASIELKRQDLPLTASGKGHQYLPPENFTRETYTSQVRRPLPPTLVGENQVGKRETFVTTTGSVHGDVWRQNPYQNEIYSKALGHWNTELYVKDLREKLLRRGHRPPLGTGESEMRGKFKAEAGVPWNGDYEFHPGLSDFRLGLVGNRAEERKGKFFPLAPANDAGVIRELDPYVSVTRKAHRPFTVKELGGYPKKDCATYWACEEYPKAWGHGPHSNPLPKESMPRPRPPMRDEMDRHNLDKFRHEARPAFAPRRALPVPHGGLTTVTRADFVNPKPLNTDFAAQIVNPVVVPNPAASKIVIKEPNHRQTESGNIGSGVPAFVTGHDVTERKRSGI